jgi:hypothetical protein
MEWARLGSVEATKAQSRFYRLFLRYSMWRTSSGTATSAVLIFAGVFLSRLAVDASRGDAPLGPVVIVLGAIGAFVLFGPLITDPISNLFLRATPSGRLLLSRAESTASTLTGVCLAVAALAGVGFMITRGTVWRVLGVVCLLLLIPIGGAAKAHGTRAWTSLSFAGGVIAAGGVLAVIVSVTAPARVGELLAVLILATVAWSLLAAYALTKYQ